MMPPPPPSSKKSSHVLSRRGAHAFKVQVGIEPGAGNCLRIRANVLGVRVVAGSGFRPHKRIAFVGGFRG